MNKTEMSQEDIDELNGIIKKWTVEKGYSIEPILSFLSCMLIGAFAESNCPEEFFDHYCKTMMKFFKNHSARKK